MREKKEMYLTNIKREIYEELNLDLNKKNIQYFFQLKIEFPITKKKYKMVNRKFYTYKYEYYTYGKAILSNKVRFAEVPVNMRYTKSNYSKIKPIIDWLPIIFGWLEARFDNKKI